MVVILRLAVQELECLLVAAMPPSVDHPAGAISRAERRLTAVAIGSKVVFVLGPPGICEA
jgi:hypothetical protein